MSTLAGLNWMLVPTLILALLLFFAGRGWVRRARGAGAKVALLLAGWVAASPGLIYAFYYELEFQDWKGFLELRTLRGSEILAAGMGLLAGALAGLPPKRSPILSGLLVAALMLLVAVPYGKQLFWPLQMDRSLGAWTGEVCRQSTGSTCGPACVATLLKRFGINATEEELARECHTTAGGTENWYMARVLRSHGLHVEYRILPAPPTSLPIPSIAGVRVGGSGHVVTVLGQTDKLYLIGEPFTGRREISKKDVFIKYQFTGFFLVVSKE
jgi:hypothetical protein